MADDNHDVLKSTARRLENAGYLVNREESGDSTLASARKHHPNLGLRDRDMPGMDGRKVCRAIRADSALNGLLGMFVSGRNAANREWLAREGASARNLSLNPSFCGTRLRV